MSLRTQGTADAGSGATTGGTQWMWVERGRKLQSPIDVRLAEYFKQLVTSLIQSWQLEMGNKLQN